jgi:AcrR family transcriptional regulator
MALAEQVDGRRLRREQNREAVVDALVALHEEGWYTPSTNEIAERAGISPRSLFRYFDDVNDLTRAAIDRHLSIHRSLFEIEIDPALPTRVKIEQFVAARVHLHETVAPGGRAGRVIAHRNETVARRLFETRTYLRNQVQRVFAPEFKGDRGALLPAVDELCSFESYEFMRTGHRMSPARATAALVAALTQLLDNERGTS